MYLVDTNIWLERLLGQAKSDEVGQLIAQTPPDQLFITDFAFHSICVILTRLKRKQALLDFVEDLFVLLAGTLATGYCFKHTHAGRKISLTGRKR
jgi:hypothetical protein